MIVVEPSEIGQKRIIMTIQCIHNHIGDRRRRPRDGTYRQIEASKSETSIEETSNPPMKHAWLT